MPGLIVTRSPWLSWRTPCPTSRTMPAASHPRIRGRPIVTPGIPLRTKISMWLIDVARTSMTTSPGPACGSATSSYFRTFGPPCSWTTTAFMGDVALGLRRSAAHADGLGRNVPTRVTGQKQDEVGDFFWLYDLSQGHSRHGFLTELLNADATPCSNLLHSRPG